MALQDKYINPFTDYGFKKLFGTEINKDLLIDFLNQVLPERHHIQDLSYTPTEQLGTSEVDNKTKACAECRSAERSTELTPKSHAEARYGKYAQKTRWGGSSSARNTRNMSTPTGSGWKLEEDITESAKR